MRLYVIFRYAALSLLLNALFLLTSAVISGLNSDTAFFPLFYSFLIALLLGLFPLCYIPPQPTVSHKEGLLIVVYSWILSCLIGLTPYIMWGGEFTFTNAWFESVSGYTTTGSTILKDIEGLPMGLLFWRSATHWIGGIGIIIFALAVLPPMGISGMVLYRSEVSGQALNDFHYTARRSMQILLMVYVGLTVSETISLILCGLDVFDAITTAFGTVATGGFSPRNGSIAHYQNLGVEIVVIVFMILSGIHFGLLFAAFRGNAAGLRKSPVVRFYLSSLLAGILLTTWNIHGANYQSWMDCLRYAAFQVISIGTSTGFATADSSIWPPMAHFVIIYFTLQCACAGSTSGGIKVDRIVLFLKSIARRIRQTKHPKAVFAIRLGDNPISDGNVDLSLLFISLYMAVIFLSSVALSALGVDTLEAFTGSAAVMGNVGPGLGNVGSVGTFGDIPAMGKWILSITMLFGRLEIYGLLVCLIPRYLR
ncbi:MAG: TrkH family potassium uptake protein [Desulfatiglandales bacterium]